MDTLLIANRGEIALRILRTCQELGVRTIALFTDADVAAPHVRAADEAVRVDNYLDIDAVVEAARHSGADAIHPGYGFLSERAAFARAVETAGLVLVGPSAAVMDRMGRKDAAREVALTAGVPVVPSYALDEAGSTVEPVAELAYPVLVKAAAGGGGKGMRVVRGPDEFADAVAAARREAASAFGDDTLLVEKYVERGRHVEVQVFGDKRGDVVHLYERDCSTQRRHQKVVEEAPAPTLDAATRSAITAAAVALAAEVGYVGAGTVEFLLDAETGDFYFLEMNTRLQVEHPVTEAVVRVAGRSLDLVALQLAVAAGAPLGFDQDDVTLAGHAVEVRVYAEDPYRGFLPQAGTATLVRWPSGAGVRVDHALESDQVVSTSYDPMLGKVITHGSDREAARRKMVRALDDTAICGLTTNTGFLRALVAGDAFADATIDTAWLDRVEIEPPDPAVARVLVAWTSAMLLAESVSGPFGADGWRLGADPAPMRIELDEPVPVDRAAGRVGDHTVRQLSAADHVLVLDIDGRRERAVVNVQPEIAEAVHRGHRFVFDRPDALGDHGAEVGDGTVTAPMPGTVLAVNVAPGDRITAEQVLGVLEAMKMELALKAPFDGVVTTVSARVGDQVALGSDLFVVTPDPEEQP